MANYKNILLKDNNGQVLLPITLSYYVEYKDGQSVKSYLDTLGDSLANINGYIGDVNSEIDNINEKIALNGEVQQNIINSVNDILTSYVAKPDYAYAVVFDNKTNTGLSDSLKNLKPVEGSSYVSTQQAIEAIDARVTSTYSYVTTSIDSLTSYANGLGEDLTELDGIVKGLGHRVDEVETKTNYAYTKVNTLFGSNGNLDLTASSIKYNGTSGAGTEGKTNVQDAIDTIGTQLQKIETSVEGVITQAGVSYVTGSGGILVNGKSDERQQGAVTVKVNLDDNKLILSGGAITVDDSKLSITSSQIDGLIPANKIEGGLDANNINITYSYVDSDGTHNDGKKSVQEFYNETDTKIKELEAASKAETLDGKYKVTVTPSDSENFAKVYTIKQGTNTVGEINIPKDQFLKKVEYVDAAHAPEGAQEGEYPALVFTWNLSDADETTGAPTSIVPISSFVDAITSGVVKDVTALKKDVETLKTSVGAIESSYITGAKINGQTVEVVDHVLQLSYNILYESGTLSEGISEGFLSSNGITLSK